MDLTPPSTRSEPRPRIKSATRLPRIGDLSEDKSPHHLSLDLSPSSPNIAPKPSSARPLHEILLLSPSSAKRSKTRLPDRLEMAEDFAVEPAPGARRRCKSRMSSSQLGCSSSPRNARRSRRRTELEVREEKELGVAEEMGRARKRRNSGRARKEKLGLVQCAPPLNPSPGLEVDCCDGINLDQTGQLLKDLILWKDVSKSTLWFGFGSLCFLSSCFAKGVSFSIFSAMSQLGLLFLGVSFFSNSYCQRVNVKKRVEFKLKEDDILRAARLVLPAANLAISKTRRLFSGDPSMTLKVTPLFLLGAEYGHLITLWRLCAIGFFVSFTVPKLYTCYISQINQRVEYMKMRMLEAWGACSHKKIVAASVVTAFWNLSTIKARIFAAFISLVIFRYYQQLSKDKLQEEEDAGEEPLQQTQQQQQALVLAKGA